MNGMSPTPGACPGWRPACSGSSRAWVSTPYAIGPAEDRNTGLGWGNALSPVSAEVLSPHYDEWRSRGYAAGPKSVQPKEAACYYAQMDHPERGRTAPMRAPAKTLRVQWIRTSAYAAHPLCRRRGPRARMGLRPRFGGHKKAAWMQPEVHGAAGLLGQ